MPRLEVKSTFVGDRILKTTRDLDSGVFITEDWLNRKRQLDRESGPARTIRDIKTGKVQKEWYRNGIPCRADGEPDNIIEDQHGNVISAIHSAANATVDAA